MHIGLDFDGVIADSSKVKNQVAGLLYGVELPADKCKRELVLKHNLLTLEQYRSVQKQLHDNRDVGLSIEPVPGVLDYIPKLQKEDHLIKIITSRDGRSVQIAYEWMKQHGLKLPITSVGLGADKNAACRGLEVYIDDDVPKLEPLLNVVPHRFLFSWPYNSNVAVNPAVATRVTSWEHLYTEIQNIT